MFKFKVLSTYEVKIKLVCREEFLTFFHFVGFSVSVQKKLLNYAFQNFPTLKKIPLTLRNVNKECCHS